MGTFILDKKNTKSLGFERRKKTRGGKKEIFFNSQNRRGEMCGGLLEKRLN